MAEALAFAGIFALGVAVGFYVLPALGGDR